MNVGCLCFPFLSNMFRFGIRRLEDYSPHLSGLKWWLTKGRVSYELLAAVQSHGDKETALFEAIVRDLRLSLGVFRTTARGRFRVLDPFVNNHLTARFGGRELTVHDWAASDCLTSAEWALSLLPNFPGLKFTASDLMLHLVEVTLERGDILIVEPSGGAVQYIRGPLVCQLDRREARSAIVNQWLAAHAHRLLRRRRDEFMDAIGALGDRQTGQHGKLRLRKLPLVHPEAEHLAAVNPQFCVCVHSAFQALPTPVDVIRTMNIFNRGYFNQQRLRDGRDAVWHSLTEGGLWIVGRTAGTSAEKLSHTVSVFEKTANGFNTVAELGGGSEIADLALEPRALQTA